ncbi:MULTISPECIES: hypothetical protein [unclassified Ruegeria]|uniref:hypothetical protein n=1 Tax=unclassified Ruegeria TaxID=2625375 RepID=UPI0014883AA8|nr:MULTISPECIES: hypothetical protein [unclassified Ruegeria]
MKKHSTDPDDAAFPIETLKIRIAVIGTLMEQIANPETWDGLTAQKLRESVRMLTEAQKLIEQATIKMGTAENMPDPTLIDHVREEMARRGLSNADAAKEQGLSRQGLWNYLNGYAKVGGKAEARFTKWLNASRKKAAADE